MRFDLEQKLELIVGTKCGKICIYSNIETGSINFTFIKVSTHPIVDLIFSSIEGAAFVLAQNATIYMVDTKKKQVEYQFLASLPLIEDKEVYLFMDDSEDFICCAFGHGKILVWEITT